MTASMHNGEPTPSLPGALPGCLQVAEVKAADEATVAATTQLFRRGIPVFSSTHTTSEMP